MDRVAIVTGGSRGIGRAIVTRLARDGVSVVVNYAGNADAAASAVAEVEAAGGRALAFQADVADEVAVGAMFDAAEKTFDGVDVVVNNAGTMALSPIADLDLAAFDAMFRTNVRGTFVVTQQAVRRIRPGGSIVNFSTSVVGTALPTYSAYTATKGAVEAMTMIVAKELRGKDITINAVAPGPTATDLFLNGKSEELVERLAKAAPLERLATPEDIAEVVAFLSSAAGHWVNGQTLRANGGLV